MTEIQTKFLLTLVEEHGIVLILNEAGAAFAEVEIKGKRKRWRITRKSMLSSWLFYIFNKATRSCANLRSVNATIRTLEAKAQFTGKTLTDQEMLCTWADGSPRIEG